MANKEHERIDTTVPINEIEQAMTRVRTEGSGYPDNVLKRLGFIHLRYRGFTLRKSAEVMGISIQTGYNWQNAWNADGMQSVFTVPKDGRRSLMTDDQRALLIRIVASDIMTTSEASDLVSREFGISYSTKQIHVILSQGGLIHVPTCDPRASGRTGPAPGRKVWIQPDECIYRTS